MPSFNDLPFELVSEILLIATEQNLRDPNCVTYTYGLTQAAKTPLHQKSNSNKHVRGRVPTDVLRWNAVDSFRRVNTTWHDWALSYALRELYIRRWRGGETWMRSAFDSCSTSSTEILPVVYQHPYKYVRSTARLFNDYPAIARNVRRVWFNGIYRYDTVNHIFSILQNCANIRTISIPWTALRYGTPADWDQLTSFPRFTSLELLAVGLKSEITNHPSSLLNHNVLANPALTFSNLRRLKLFGDSNIMPIDDNDLLQLSHSATNLREILIANVNSITIQGVAAVIAASKNTLQLIDFTNTAPAQPDQLIPAHTQTSHHICALLASCTKLRDLAISIPTLCPELFAHDNPWQETVRLRVASAGDDVDAFAGNLEAARDLIRRKDGRLDIEVAVGGWLFDVKERMVHGSFKKVRAEVMQAPSVKGPYGYTGIHGGEAKGEWNCVGEQDFMELVRAGLVRL